MATPAAMKQKQKYSRDELRALRDSTASLLIAVAPMCDDVIAPSEPNVPTIRRVHRQRPAPVAGKPAVSLTAPGEALRAAGLTPATGPDGLEDLGLSTAEKMNQSAATTLPTQTVSSKDKSAAHQKSVKSPSADVASTTTDVSKTSTELKADAAPFRPGPKSALQSTLNAATPAFVPTFATAETTADSSATKGSDSQTDAAAATTAGDGSSSATTTTTATGGLSASHPLFGAASNDADAAMALALSAANATVQIPTQQRRPLAVKPIAVGGVAHEVTRRPLPRRRVPARVINVFDLAAAALDKKTDGVPIEEWHPTVSDLFAGLKGTPAAKPKEMKAMMLQRLAEAKAGSNEARTITAALREAQIRKTIAAAVKDQHAVDAYLRTLDAGAGCGDGDEEADEQAKIAEKEEKELIQTAPLMSITQKVSPVPPSPFDEAINAAEWHKDLYLWRAAVWQRAHAACAAASAAAAEAASKKTEGALGGAAQSVAQAATSPALVPSMQNPSKRWDYRASIWAKNKTAVAAASKREIERESERVKRDAIEKDRADAAKKVSASLSAEEKEKEKEKDKERMKEEKERKKKERKEKEAEALLRRPYGGALVETVQELYELSDADDAECDAAADQ